MDASGHTPPACQGMVQVNAYASFVCPFPLVDSWQVIRDWSSFAWLPQLFGSRLDSALQVPDRGFCLLYSHVPG